MNLDGLYVRTPFGATRPDGVTANRVPFDHSPASPADILPRLGFEVCEVCEGDGTRADIYDDEGNFDVVKCLSCRRGWTPGDAVVEVMAKAISDSIRERGDVVEYVAEALVRAAAFALLDHLSGGSRE